MASSSVMILDDVTPKLGPVGEERPKNWLEDYVDVEVPIDVEVRPVAPCKSFNVAVTHSYHNGGYLEVDM